MTVLFRDDFPGTSLDTGKWTPAGGGSVSVGSGLLTLTAKRIVTNSTFALGDFVSFQVVANSGSFDWSGGFYYSGGAHYAMGSSGSVPDSTLGIGAYSFTSGSFSTLANTADPTSAVFGLYVLSLSHTMMGFVQQIAGTWYHIGAFNATLNPNTGGFSAFLQANTSTTSTFEWIQVEDVFPGATSSPTYYVPNLQGHPEVSSSSLNFSPAKTI